MKIPQLYKTRCFITVFTQAHNYSLSSAGLIQPTTSHHISLRSTLIFFESLPCKPSSSKQVFLPQALQPKSYMHLSPLLCVQQCAPVSMECNCFIYFVSLSCFSDVLTRKNVNNEMERMQKGNFFPVSGNISELSRCVWKKKQAQ